MSKKFKEQIINIKKRECQRQLCFSNMVVNST